MIWIISAYALLMTLLAAHYGTRMDREKARAIALEIACERAEQALEEIVEMGKVETAEATIWSNPLFASRMGVDIKSRLP